ncbi:MAG: hypothetical protein PHW04_05955 [Candidatus Wallbacteria bacterium]|nr:hypothetical protein [Candidatus Wallbacteria bacterium]
MKLKSLLLFLFVSLAFTGCIFKRSGDIIFPAADTPWHFSIEATIFNITAVVPQGRTAFNDVDAASENPYYLALPFNPSAYSGPSGAYPADVKNLWVQIVNTVNQRSCYAQWEDVGPWFVDDCNYVFSTDGKIRPATESLFGKTAGIFLHSQNQTVRTVLNKAGIDLSPATAEYLGISGKGLVHWRLVDQDSVPFGPWSQKISTTAPHYKSKVQFSVCN